MHGFKCDRTYCHTWNHEILKYIFFIRCCLTLSLIQQFCSRQLWTYFVKHRKSLSLNGKPMTKSGKHCGKRRNYMYRYLTTLYNHSKHTSISEYSGISSSSLSSSLNSSVSTNCWMDTKAINYIYILDIWWKSHINTFKLLLYTYLCT